MKKRFTEEQIIPILKEAEAGLPVKELCRKYNISDATFYTWRKKYGVMEVSHLKGLKEQEEENQKLKRIYADQALPLEMAKDVISEKWQILGPEEMLLAI